MDTAALFEALSPLDRQKGLAALEQVRVERVTDADGPLFDAAYRLLDGFFGPRGELEAREVLAGFVRQPVLDFGGGLLGVYHLVALRAGDELVGVRDLYVDLDPAAGVCVVALSHSLVVPAWRRSGLAALLRALPLPLAREVQQAHLGRTLPTLVAAEMEPADPHNPDTVVRLLAYGRSGFGVLEPARFRYSQPDFRADVALQHTGIPLLGVVRVLGLEADAPAAVPAELVAAYPRLFHACHRVYLPESRVGPSHRWADAHLDLDAGPVPLLPLPTGPDTLDHLAPLVRGAVLPLYPPGLRGPEPTFGDPAEELALLRRGWRPRGVT